MGGFAVSDHTNHKENNYYRVAKEQLKTASQMVIKILLGSDGKWDELVGTFKEDGTKVVSITTFTLHSYSDRPFARASIAAWYS